MPGPPDPEGVEQGPRDVSQQLEGYSEKMLRKARKLAAAELGDTLTVERVVNAAATIELAADIQVQRFSDKIDLLHREGRMPAIACRKGCWFCCTTHVMVSVPEVLRLAVWIQEHFSQEEVNALKQRLAAYVERVFEVRKSKDQRPPILCPILVDGACSAHPGRPIACRGANSFDVEACKRGLDDWRVDHDIPLVAQTFYAGKAMVHGLNEELESRGVRSPIVDMPLALHIAMNDATAGERHLAGEPVFEIANVNSTATAF